MMYAFLRSRLDDAAAGGFALLRRLPSTSVWKTLSYLDSLSDAERSAAFDTCTDVAADRIAVHFQGERPKPTPVGAAAYETPAARLGWAIHSRPRWSQFSDRFLRQFASDPAALSQMVDASRVASICAAAPPVAAKAPAIRKALHAELKRTFDAAPVNHGAGLWSYVGRVDGAPFSLNIDYGGRGAGFRYGVVFPSPSSPALNDGGVTLEESYGFPAGVCDFPLADELDALAVTMCEVVQEIARLRTRTLSKTPT